jgi:hypothetical protein
MMAPAVQTGQVAAPATPLLNPQPLTGRMRSRLNACVHGGTGRTVLLPHEDCNKYAEHCQGYITDHHPVGKTESDLTYNLANIAWRLDRFNSWEEGILALAAPDVSINFNLSNEQNASEPGPNRQLIEDSLRTAAEYLNQQKQFNLASLYRSRASREFERTLKLLKQLQAERKCREQAEEAERKAREEAQRAQRAKEMEKAIQYYKYCKMKGEGCDPQSCNFVFSVSEIEAEIARRKANRRVEVAAECKFDPKKFALYDEETDMRRLLPR